MRWAVVVAAVAVSVPELAAASERLFAYAYESAVLGPGQVELEPWTTVRAGRSEFYRRFDERLEFEFGLAPRLQTSLYLNASAKASGLAGARENEFEFEGVSSEWKLKLSDPVAHVLGSALYLEGTLSPLEAELEAKVILDKRNGDFVAALNLVGEFEWSLEGPQMEQAITVEAVLGLGYQITSAWSVGVEARSVNLLGEKGSSALYLGPTVAYASQKWWAALSLQPQVAALHGASAGSTLDLDHNERVQGRLLLGFHL
ncbi:MAG TPA: hypothetical protein VGK67_28430 [Myxococcales bacterium]|jgi:hypothetical protein